ncbi:MAG: hypothetical protein DIZ80_14390 [endosymbiont of Galathealinum brachiosum]|uniref:RND efflux pump membrane fusion protein barrel-sandwich domain-containing protein n=1 Tax=endosymbiont of Galathealinum brachiosum TaxID=2200906 RepID=A0A370D8T0_9GAMM|nr:MAG: hypothetical protein DIZ80_14390 [endosymbiont of Galathealinum brachiosum]
MKNNKLLVMITLIGFHVISQAAELEAKLGWTDYQRHGFAVNGVVDKVQVKVGEKVKEGMVLAKLGITPFNYHIKKCQAKSDKFNPEIFDAKIELDQAEELFERTVLSEVELQIIDGKYKKLIESQKEVNVECLLSRWQAKLSVLKARDFSYVLSSNITESMVISDENKTAVFIELVSAKQASAVSLLSYQQKTQFNIGQEIKVIVDQQAFPAKIESIAMRPDKDNKYKLEAVFYYTKMIEPEKLIKLNY